MIIQVLRKVANEYGCNGTEISNHICEAFNKLADEIEDEQKKNKREQDDLIDQFTDPNH